MDKRRQELQTTDAKNENKHLKYSFQPYQIGGISTYEKNQFKYDASQRKFLFIDSKYLTDKSTETGKKWSGRMWSNLNMNLNENYEDFKGDYDDTKTSFDKLLNWISSRKVSQEGNLKKLFKNDLSKEDSLDSPKNYFVCTRGVLVFIFSSKYKNKTKDVNTERDKDFLICATKFQGVIYLRKIPKEKNTEGNEEKEKNESNDALRKNIYYGHKFEHNITRLKKSDPDSIPNLNKEFYAVMNAHFDIFDDAQFDDYYLIFSAQMDAVDGSSFVEIKTNFELVSERRKNSFRWKLLSWYLQCFIAGVPRLICGFRNNDGIVNTVKEYEVSALPGMAENLWSPNECFNFGARFLSLIKQRVVKDDPKTVYTFSLESGENGFACEEGGDPFLPDWYISKMLQLHELQCQAPLPYSFF